MARVTIQEASYKLNLSQAVIRDCIRKGELQAFREAGPRGLRWVVELPENGWVEDFTASLYNLSSQMTPWWWPTEEKEGLVHYVQDLGIEEIEPIYLCGLKGNNVWDASGHALAERCTECTGIAVEQGLPLWNE